MPILFDLAFMGASIGISIVVDVLALCASSVELHRSACEAAIEASDPVGFFREMRS